MHRLILFVIVGLIIVSSGPNGPTLVRPQEVPNGDHGPVAMPRIQSLPSVSSSVAPFVYHQRKRAGGEYRFCSTDLVTFVRDICDAQNKVICSPSGRHRKRSVPSLSPPVSTIDQWRQSEREDLKYVSPWSPAEDLNREEDYYDHHPFIVYVPRKNLLGTEVTTLSSLGTSTTDSASSFDSHNLNMDDTDPTIPAMGELRNPWEVLRSRLHLRRLSGHRQRQRRDRGTTAGYVEYEPLNLSDKCCERRCSRRDLLRACCDPSGSGNGSH